MPNFNVIDYGPDPIAQALGNFGQGFSNRYVNDLRQNEEADILQSIFNELKTKPNASEEDMLQSILTRKGLPLETKSAVFNVSKAARENARQKQAAQALAKQHGLPAGLSMDEIKLALENKTKQEATAAKTRSNELKEEKQKLEKEQFDLEKNSAKTLKDLAGIKDGELTNSAALKLVELNKKASKEKVKKEKEAQEVQAILSQRGFKGDDLDKLSGVLSPASARALIQPDTFEKEEDRLKAQRINKTIVGIDEQAEGAENDLMTIDFLNSIVKEATDSPIRTAFANQLIEKGGIWASFGNFLKEPETRLFETASKQFFTNFGDIIKGKISNFEFGTLMNMLAQVTDKPETAQAILRSQQLVRDIKVKEREIKDQIINEYESQGKRLPGNLSSLISERLKPQADELVQKAKEDIKKLIGKSPKETPKAKPKTNNKKEIPESELEAIYNSHFGE